MTNPTNYQWNATNMRLCRNLLCILQTTSSCCLWKVTSTHGLFQKTHLSVPLAPKSMLGSARLRGDEGDWVLWAVPWGLPASSTGGRLSWLRPQHPSSPHLLPLLRARRGWWCSLGIGALARRTWSGWDWTPVGEFGGAAGSAFHKY